jgi:hypothetical protein
MLQRDGVSVFFASSSSGTERAHFDDDLLFFAFGIGIVIVAIFVCFGHLHRFSCARKTRGRQIRTHFAWSLGFDDCVATQT